MKNNMKTVTERSNKLVMYGYKLLFTKPLNILGALFSKTVTEKNTDIQTTQD